MVHDVFDHGSSRANCFSAQIYLLEWLRRSVANGGPITVLGGTTVQRRDVPDLLVRVNAALESWTEMRSMAYAKSARDRVCTEPTADDDADVMDERFAQVWELCEKFEAELRAAEKDVLLQNDVRLDDSSALSAAERDEFVEKLLYCLFVRRPTRPQVYFACRISHWLQRGPASADGVTLPVGEHKALGSTGPAVVVVPPELLRAMEFYVQHIRRHQLPPPDEDDDDARAADGDGDGDGPRAGDGRNPRAQPKADYQSTLLAGGPARRRSASDVVLLNVMCVIACQVCLYKVLGGSMTARAFFRTSIKRGWAQTCTCERGAVSPPP